MIRSVPGAIARERLTVELFRHGEPSALLLDGAEIDQGIRDQRMRFSIRAPVDLDGALVQRLGDIVVTHIELRVRQLGQTGGEIERLASGL